jgi:hypothetical protein
VTKGHKPLRHVVYCGKVECLHIIWDMREARLLPYRTRLANATLPNRCLECPLSEDFNDYVCRSGPILTSYGLCCPRQPQFSELRSGDDSTPQSRIATGSV